MSELDAVRDAGAAGAPDPLCFVLMPFGRKSDVTGATIDFDAVYRELIAPAVRAADLEPLRADEEVTGGIVHKPMFERLILCEFAVADLTFANANVFYELGVRHAVRPYSTVLLFAAGTRLPFDVELDRGIPYALTPTGAPADLDAARRRLSERLMAARDASVDSPVFQLIEGFPEIDRLKTDVFRDQVRYSTMWKERLERARRQGLQAVRAAERELGDLRNVEAGILVDVYLSYRAVNGHEEMVSLAARLPRPLARTPLVREQLGFALNRLGRREEAERVLLALIGERGPSSETYGLLGRVYKDMWSDAREAGEELLAEGLLEKAVEAYLAGFEADWRDAYPGINAVSLMEFQEPPDPRREQLLPVVAYAVDRRLDSGQSDYWDHATRLELAVLAKDEAATRRALGRALAMVRENWEPESTAGNLRLIREARSRRGDDVPWAEAAEQELLRRAGRSSAG
ncbi:TRAFs-binding domain-containing protein [Blastococcus deserti]|uniref:TRAFs-binding domain-containing protein n=1 Tax=Blastococcus deserti TaxID=2259033 RepID=A0ABW4XF49_9ACTN